MNRNYCTPVLLISQTHGLPNIPPIILDWCDKKLLFKGRGKIIPSGSSATPLIKENISSLDKNEFHIGLYTKGSEFICVDIDSTLVAESFIRLVIDLKFKVLAVRTPRGGVHLYFRKPEMYGLYNFGNTYRVTQLGVVVEFKSECMVTTLGPGYTILVAPNSIELDVIPDYFFPLPWTPGRSKFRNRTFVREELIQEGFRNQFLFEWSSFMFQNSDAFLISREKAVRALATYFCSPPLLDENEIENLIHVENRISKEQSDGSETDNFQPSVWVEAFFEKWGYTRFRYHNSNKEWFKYSPNELAWISITEIQFQSEIYEEFGHYPRAHSLRRPAFLNNFTQLFALRVILTEEEIENVVGMSFKNGFLDFKTMKLEKHLPERFITSTLPINYNPSEIISDKMMVTLSLFCRDNAAYVNHLRGFVRRAIILEPSCHTVLLLSGPPGSGKSTFISFLSEVFGKMFIALDVRGKNQFDRFAWIDKRILVLNDVTQLDPPLVELVRQLSGRDRIKYDIKSKQVNRDFVYKGIIIVVSNQTADTLLTSMMDLAAFDRIIEVRFDYVPERKIRNFTEFLVKGTSGFISWALHCPDSILQEQVCTSGLSVTADNPVIMFITTRLKHGSDESISFSTLIREFETFLVEMSIKIKTKNSTSFFSVLSDFCIKFFNVAIFKSRSRNGIQVTGVRLLVPKEDSNFLFKPRIDPLKKVDPWVYRKDDLGFTLSEESIGNILLDEYNKDRAKRGEVVSYTHIKDSSEEILTKAVSKMLIETKDQLTTDKVQSKPNVISDVSKEVSKPSSEINTLEKIFDRQKNIFLKFNKKHKKFS